MNGRPIRFLELEVVLALHRIAIEDQGGDPAVRDLGLLEAALAMPRQQLGGEFLHPDVPAMAAAYAFHICKNHPFVDGNKRAAFASMLAFLIDNDWGFDADPAEAERVVLALAAGELDKDALTRWVRANSHAKPSMELREFFRRLDLASVNEMANAVAASGREHEALATVDEAGAAIPLIRELDAIIRQVASDPTLSDEDKGRVKGLGDVIVTLTAIHRIAEDLGYEW